MWIKNISRDANGRCCKLDNGLQLDWFHGSHDSSGWNSVVHEFTRLWKADELEDWNKGNVGERQVWDSGAGSFGDLALNDPCPVLKYLWIHLSHWIRAVCASTMYVILQFSVMSQWDGTPHKLWDSGAVSLRNLAFDVHALYGNSSEYICHVE